MQGASKNSKSESKVKQPQLIKIAILLLIAGILSFVFSVTIGIQVLALIGLGLTFWCVLLFLLKPVNFVEGSLLYNSAVSMYSTIDRIIEDFNCKGKGYYIAPYPKGVYLPEYLKGLKTSNVFISAEKGATMPSIEEMAKGKFISKNPKGVLLTPPGSGILIQIEEKMKLDFTKMDLDELCVLLPIHITQDLNLAKEMAIILNGDEAHLKIVDSLYKNLYNVRDNLKSVGLLGCPIASAVACALAKNSGRIVTIQKHQVSPDGSAVKLWYRIGQGDVG